MELNWGLLAPVDVQAMFSVPGMLESIHDKSVQLPRTLVVNMIHEFASRPIFDQLHAQHKFTAVELRRAYIITHRNNAAARHRLNVAMLELNFRNEHTNLFINRIARETQYGIYHHQLWTNTPMYTDIEVKIIVFVLLVWSKAVYASGRPLFINAMHHITTAAWMYPAAFTPIVLTEIFDLVHQLPALHITVMSFMYGMPQYWKTAYTDYLLSKITPPPDYTESASSALMGSASGPSS